MIQKSFDINKRSFRGYAGLGSIYADEGDLTKAEEMFLKAIEINPDKSFVYFKLATVYIRMGDLEKAEDVYQKALAYDPGVAEEIRISIEQAIPPVPTSSQS